MYTACRDDVALLSFVLGKRFLECGGTTAQGKFRVCAVTFFWSYPLWHSQLNLQSTFSNDNIAAACWLAIRHMGTLFWRKLSRTICLFFFLFGYRGWISLYLAASSSLSRPSDNDVIMCRYCSILFVFLLSFVCVGVEYTTGVVLELFNRFSSSRN